MKSLYIILIAFLFSGCATNQATLTQLEDRIAKLETGQADQDKFIAALYNVSKEVDDGLSQLINKNRDYIIENRDYINKNTKLISNNATVYNANVPMLDKAIRYMLNNPIKNAPISGTYQ